MELSAAGSVELPTAQHQDDEELSMVRRAEQGDDYACRWILARYRTRIVRLCAHVLKSPSDAEDAAQETFVLALQRLHQWRGERFEQWLFRIAVRVCLQRMRRFRFRRERALAPSEHNVPSQNPDAVLRITIEGVLQSLTPPLRAALVLREVEGYEYSEISATLGIPIGTVRSRLSAAREQFRRLYLQLQEEHNAEA